MISFERNRRTCRKVLKMQRDEMFIRLVDFGKIVIDLVATRYVWRTRLWDCGDICGY